MSRKYDIVVFGATGFTGELVAKYMIEHCPSELRWALGGRDLAKLKTVSERLGRTNIDLLVADSSNQASMDAMVAQTRVVLTTVGPYSKYGTPLVDACVRLGAHYCDLTGESPWIRKMIDKYHQQAEEKGVAIVHCCGFDSIPSDLGVLMVVRHMSSKLNRKCGPLKYIIGPMKGGASGGTLASMVELFNLPREELKKSRDPYFLNPTNMRGETRQPDMKFIEYDEDVGKWVIPFFMGPVNTRIVRRSNALLGNSYGPTFVYKEVASFNSMIQAFFVWLGMAAFVVLMAIPFTRGLLQKVLPKPGEGPTEQQRKEGHFTVTFVGETHPESPTEKPTKVRAKVNGYADPGYGETAKMISESAICLATLPRNSLKGGVVTPASSMGLELVERLKKAGMTFEITSPPPSTN